MATDTIKADEGTHPADAEASHHHPTERQYVIIALILGAITAVEVALYYVDTGALNVPLLLILAAAKFIVVVGYFMHLKFDSRLFRNLFITGLILAILVYAAYLATMGVLPWDRGDNPFEEGEQALRSLIR